MNRNSVVLTTILALFLLLFTFNVVTAQENAQTPFLGIGFSVDESGIVVTKVLPDSPAATAGLAEGDIITAIDGETVDVNKLPEAIHSFDVGNQVELSILRDSEPLSLDVTLSNVPVATPATPRLPMDAFAYVQNGEEKVWQIRSLTENNPLYEAGLRAGDTITEFDGQVYDPTAFRSFLTDLEEDATVAVTVERGDETLEIDVPAPALQALDRFSLGFSFSDNAGALVPFNEFFDFEPFEFFGEQDSLFNMFEDMLERYIGPEGFQFNIPGSDSEV
jgi:C-terminal processing protease CtpA/Prc